MRIPHTINSNTFSVYSPSEVTLNLVGEDERPLKPEEPGWDDNIPPPLITLCVKALAAGFKDKPILEQLSNQDRDLLFESLPTDLPLELTVPLIPDGIFWKRSAQNHWSSMNYVRDYGSSWKRLYLERYLQEYLETMTGENYDIEKIKDMVKLCSPYVHRLRVHQLKLLIYNDPNKSPAKDGCITEISKTFHINMQPVISGLKLLEEVDIIFGEQNCGMNFKWSLFEFTLKDCENIGLGASGSRTLTVLRLHRSGLDDKKIISLLQGLSRNHTLLEIDFSHCKLGDIGALALGKFVANHPKLQSLNLCNNKIGPKGISRLMFGLSQPHSCPLQKLNLRLNNTIGNKGVANLCSGYLKTKGLSKKLLDLNLAACHIGQFGSMMIALMLNENPALQILDLSNNNIGERGGNIISKGLNGNRTLFKMDLRMTGVTEEAESRINLFLKENFKHYKKIQQTNTKLVGAVKK